MAELRRLGNYEIRGVLGKGGAATVYRAWDGMREVALKVLHRGLIEGKGFVERFNREMEIVWRLKHPNVLRIFDAGFEKTEKRYYFAMELVEGKTAREVLERVHRFPLEASLRIALNILSALDHAHGKGVIHRDVKSENVFLTDDGRIYLMDFGIARELEKSPVTGGAQRVGTPQTMAPECFLGTSLGGRADVYAAGLLLYEFLVGHSACPDGSADGARRFHLYVDPIPPSELMPDLSPELNDLIMKALEKAPDRRFRTAEAMAKAIESFVESASLSLPSRVPPLSLAALPRLPAPRPVIPGQEGELPDGLRRLLPRSSRADLRGKAPSVEMTVAAAELETPPTRIRRLQKAWQHHLRRAPWKRTLIDLAVVFALSVFFLAWNRLGNGYLSLTSYPSGAQVLDGSGRALGQTPLPLLRLPTGEVELSLKSSDGRRARLRSRIRSGHVTRLHLRF